MLVCGQHKECLGRVQLEPPRVQTEGRLVKLYLIRTLPHSSHNQAVVGQSLSAELQRTQRELQALSLEGSPYKDGAMMELLVQRLRTHFGAAAAAGVV